MTLTLGDLRIPAPKVAAGKLFVLSQGTYSDFSYDGFFVALQNINFGQQLEDFSKIVRPSQWRKAGGRDAFIGYLIKQGLMAMVDYDEIWIDEHDYPLWRTE
ncbi:MAG: hypothetical protein RL563_2680 [Pseudomonadota bacterium]|jgi:hypothetical protein